MDTRYGRDKHWLPSVGHLRPKGAVIAAFSRFLVKMFAFGYDYAGKVLSDVQWNWLENELVRTDSDDEDGITTTILISSIQLLTTNPMVESWGK